VGWDIFTNPRFVGGIAKRELLQVWMPPTVVVVALGCWWSRSRRAVHLGCAWLAVIAIYYVVTMRTTSGIWGVYYHVVSVPAVALLVGAGVDALVAEPWWYQRPSRWARAFGWLGAVSVCAAFVWELGADYAQIANRAEDPLYVCAKQFKPALTEDGLLVASGDACRDPAGHLLAGNKPYMFYWLDRKGFNVCEEDQSVEVLKSLAGRGARYFVAEHAALQSKPGFESELRTTFPVIAECNAALFLKLS
jgi:hypothetical protein